jgi:hypothetical protein
MNKDALERGIGALRAALEKALVRDEAVNRCAAMLLFLKRLTDLAHHPRSGTSFVTAEYPALLRKLAHISWETMAQVDDPAAEVHSMLEEVETAVKPLLGLSRFNTLVYSLHAAARAKVTVQPVFSAVAAISLEELSDPDMISVFQDALDAPSRHAASATTPTTIRELIARLFANETSSNIYDPAAGTGLLIGEVCDRMRINWATPMLFGQELAIDLVNLARIRAFLSRCQFDFRAGDTLLDPEFAGDGRRFDLVVAHPPFGKIDPQIAANPRFAKYKFSATATYEVAFLQHVIESMSDVGRAAVVVPTGVLSRSIDRNLREGIVRAHRLDAVIGLPPFLFTGTDIAASILLLRGPESGKSKDVVFVDLGTSIAGQKTRPILSDAGIAGAIMAVTNRATKPSFSSTATERDLAVGDYDLSVTRYVRRLEPTCASLEDNLQLFSEAQARRNKAENKAMALLAPFSGTLMQPSGRGSEE